MLGDFICRARAATEGLIVNRSLCGRLGSMYTVDKIDNASQHQVNIILGFLC